MRSSSVPVITKPYHLPTINFSSLINIHYHYLNIVSLDSQFTSMDISCCHTPNTQDSLSTCTPLLLVSTSLAPASSCKNQRHHSDSIIRVLCDRSGLLTRLHGQRMHREHNLHSELFIHAQEAVKYSCQPPQSNTAIDGARVLCDACGGPGWWWMLPEWVWLLKYIIYLIFKPQSTQSAQSLVAFLCALGGLN